MRSWALVEISRRETRQADPALVANSRLCDTEGAQRAARNPRAAYGFSSLTFEIGVRNRPDSGTDRALKPGWRNWQTQRTQNPPTLAVMGVRPPLPAPTESKVPAYIR